MDPVSSNSSNGSLPPKTLKATQDALPIDFFDTCRSKVESDPFAVLARHAITHKGPNVITQDMATAEKVDHVFSKTIKYQGKITNQRQSGRCWIFSGFNVMRPSVMEKHNLESFEFSQTYAFFCDKLEAAHSFLSRMIDLRESPILDREVQHLMRHPIGDGGFWHGFANIVEKYGAVPHGTMEETYNSKSSREMNAVLGEMLHKYAMELREAEGLDVNALKEREKEMMEEVYRQLTFHLGVPPKSFDWTYEDITGKEKTVKDLTPLSFVEEHCDTNVTDKVVLANVPMRDKPLQQQYVFEYTEKVIGGEKDSFLNVELDVMKKACMASIDAGEPVWFGCDVGAEYDKKRGVLRDDLRDVTGILGHDVIRDKGKRLEYSEATLSHAMTLVGYDCDESGKVSKWKVENSWGKDSGENGFLAMTDEWFNRHVYEVVPDKRFIDAETLKLLKLEPKTLKPWDPANLALHTV